MTQQPTLESSAIAGGSRSSQPSRLSQSPRHTRVTNGVAAANPFIEAPSGAGLTQLGQGDQRIYQALHALEPRPLTDLNNCSHRSRRTRNVLSQRVPFEQSRERPGGNRISTEDGMTNSIGQGDHFAQIGRG